MDNEKNAEKISFVMYADYEESFNLLSDEDKGKLISAIFRYAITQIVPTLTGEVKMAFSFIKSKMDHDYTRWTDIKQKRVEAGKKGGIASGETRKSQNNE